MTGTHSLSTFLEIQADVSRAKSIRAGGGVWCSVEVMDIFSVVTCRDDFGDWNCKGPSKTWCRLLTEPVANEKVSVSYATRRAYSLLHRLQITDCLDLIEGFEDNYIKFRKENDTFGQVMALTDGVNWWQMDWTEEGTWGCELGSVLYIMKEKLAGQVRGYCTLVDSTHHLYRKTRTCRNCGMKCWVGK